MQKAELKELVSKALAGAGTTVADRTAPSQTEYFDLDLRHPGLPGGQLRARFFIWELTPDQSAAGRPAGEHKLQLTLGDRSKKTHNFASVTGRENFLLGYSEGTELFVGFQIELHKNFAWSKLVACRDEALTSAKKIGWATHLRGRSPNTGERELAIAFKPDRMVVEAKSLPTEIGGQWRQVFVGVGELARYSMVYEDRFKQRPTRVLALERLPQDGDLQRFLRNLHDNEEIAVVWPEGDLFRTFSSHHEAIPWLANAID